MFAVAPVVDGGDGHRDLLTVPDASTVELGDDERRLVHECDPVAEASRVAGHVEQAVGFPMDVGQLGEDVAGDLRPRSHRLDLVAQRLELTTLRLVAQRLPTPEDLVEVPESGAFDRTVNVGGTSRPFLAGLEPPRLLPGRVDEAAQVREAPGPELRDDERFGPRPLGVTVRAEGEI